MVNIRFTVFGFGQPGGSKRVVPIHKKDGTTRHQAIDDNPMTVPWKYAVAAAAQAAHAGQPLLDCPLRVGFIFYRPRPRGHFKKDGTLNAEGQRSIAPGTKPDVLKLARSTEDALTGVLWTDDARITTEILAKRWGEPARLEAVIEPDDALGIE